jgi:pyruvate kinase
VLSWGVEPYLAARSQDVNIMFQKAARLAHQTGIAKKGQLVVITAGIPMGVQGSTNVIKVQQVG